MNTDQLYFYNRGFNDCLAKGIDTHPAKTLTDEEIAQEWGNFCPNVLEFARAILRKAQEK